MPCKVGNVREQENDASSCFPGGWRWGSSSRSPKGAVPSPQGPSLGKGGKETAFCWTHVFLCPVSFQWRWQVSAFLHLLNWKEAIENSFDFQWQLVLARYWRAKQANTKHLQTKMYFFPCCFFLLFLWKSNVCMRGMKTWTLDLQISSCVSQPVCFQWGETELVKGWWCSPGALQDRDAAGVSQNCRDWLQCTDKQAEPVSNAPKRNDGKTDKETTSRVTAKTASPADSLLSRILSTADEPSYTLIIAGFFSPSWKYSQTPEQEVSQ